MEASSFKLIHMCQESGFCLRGFPAAIAGEPHHPRLRIRRGISVKALEPFCQELPGSSSERWHFRAARSLAGGNSISITRE